MVRPADALVWNILDPSRVPRPAAEVLADQAAQHYKCNQEGQQLRALPTLVARPRSYAFRDGGQGMIWDVKRKVWDEPNPTEREKAMGYSGTDTLVPGFTPEDRQAITGKCMDANCLQSLLAMCWELNREGVCSARYAPEVADQGLRGVASVVTDQPEGAEPEPFDLQAPAIQDTMMPPWDRLEYRSVDEAEEAEYQYVCMVAEVAQAEESELAGLSDKDVWKDQEVMDYLNFRVSPAENPKRVHRRAAHYQVVGEQVCRKMKDGTSRIVPPPSDRVGIVKKVHEGLGHFGVKRTRKLVLLSYWWAGMEDDVVRVLRACPHCRQVNTHLISHQPSLHPLPVEGYMYRWSCDLAGPLPTTNSGNQYVFIAIEHYSKHLEVAAIPNKEALTTSAVFLSHVLCRFGACAEVVTDQGTEWQKEFHELLANSFIDHRMTSPSHPQANGLTERAVQTFKLALSKHIAQEGTTGQWDQYLHYIALGYRCSPQASTKLSPFELMYGVSPVLPTTVRDSFTPALDYPGVALSSTGASVDRTAEQSAADFLLTRAQLLRDNMASIDENLKVAQHRDTLRYAAKRDGKWLPRLHKFQVGDFVYRKRPNRLSTVQPKMQDGIYMVHEVRDSGVLVLQGKCGGVMSVHVTNCAPCHLVGFDTTLDPTLSVPTADLPCEVCGSPDQEEVMLLCDSCNQGYHTHCLQPPLSSIPDGVWICPRCQDLMVTEEQVRERMAAQPATQVASAFKSKGQRMRAAAARNLEGRVVQWYPPRGSQHQGQGPFYGEVQYQEDSSRYPRPLWGQFPTLGRQGPWTVAMVEKMLVPEGAAVPMLTAAAAVVSGAFDRPSTPLPDAMTFPSWSQSAVRALRQAVVPQALGRGLDAWGDGPSRRHPLRPLVRQMRVNSLQGRAEYSCNPLDARSFAEIARQYVPDVVFVNTPEEGIFKCVRAVQPYAMHLTCVLVPEQRLTCPAPVVSRWLARHQQRGLVRFIPVPEDEACWVLIARSTTVWQFCLFDRAAHLQFRPSY